MDNRLREYLIEQDKRKDMTPKRRAAYLAKLEKKIKRPYAPGDLIFVCNHTRVYDAFANDTEWHNCTPTATMYLKHDIGDIGFYTTDESGISTVGMNFGAEGQDGHDFEVGVTPEEVKAKVLATYKARLKWDEDMQRQTARINALNAAAPA